MKDTIIGVPKKKGWQPLLYNLIFSHAKWQVKRRASMLLSMQLQTLLRCFKRWIIFCDTSLEKLSTEKTGMEFWIKREGDRIQHAQDIMREYKLTFNFIIKKKFKDRCEDSGADFVLLSFEIQYKNNLFVFWEIRNTDMYRINREYRILYVKRLKKASVLLHLSWHWMLKPR